MADICIFYASEDKAFVGQLVAWLETRWEIWWDDKLIGRWNEVVEREVPRAQLAIPVWSQYSQSKPIVQDETTLAERKGLKILPVRIDSADPPLGFGSYSFVELHDWNGDPDHPGLRELEKKLASVVPPRARTSGGHHIRPHSIGNEKVKLPSLFMSVSSYETQLAPLEAAVALGAFGAPLMLLSAYDLIPHKGHDKNAVRKLKDELAHYRSDGGFVLIDSGQYESGRLDDEQWTNECFKAALADTPHDWTFCFDDLDPPSEPAKIIGQIVKSVERDRQYTSAPVLPIVHTPTDKEGKLLLGAVPEIVYHVAKELRPPMIGIPERELGPGIMASAETVMQIRRKLEKLDRYQPVHLLGTGNPWSLAILSAAGADSFDGLEWCRMLIDRKQGRLHHRQHFDFVRYQVESADSIVTRDALTDDKIPFKFKVAFHNLDYYSELQEHLRNHAANGTLATKVMGLLGEDNMQQLNERLPELFK